MKALVIGAGISGLDCARLLNKNGYDVYLTDMRAIQEKDSLVKEGIKIFDEGHPESLKNIKYDLIVKNPGIKYQTPFVDYFVKQGYLIYNELDVASSLVKNYRFASVTGTNGKTTTTTLLGELLKNINPLNDAVGNIGQALSTVVLKNGDIKLDLAVEISAFQLLGCHNYHPVVSVVTNLSPDHVDYFEKVDNYYQTKMRVYKYQKDDDWFLLNLDDELVVKYATNIPCKVVTYSLNKNADLCLKDNHIYLFDKILFDTDDLQIPGKHNLYNAMVAAAMAYKMGVKPEQIKETIRNFKGVEHRLQFVKEVNGVKYFNDSKGTNPASTAVALKAFEKPVILLAGGYDKKTGFDDIRPYLNKVKTMYVFGETKYQLKELFPEAIICETLEEATKLAYDNAKSGDTVLLSPMCASWDQFKCFEERGDLFVSIVKSF